jgi:hypothetical protein
VRRVAALLGAAETKDDWSLLMPNIDHIMPNPYVVPIFWGHEYAANLRARQNMQKMISDLVTGPFMNGLAQYGVRRGTMHDPIIIDDPNPPATLTYTDSSNTLIDEITKKLISWISAGTVPQPTGPDDVNRLYVIIPSVKTLVRKYNGVGDPTGNGVQGFHNEGQTSPSPPPHYYWAIVKSQDSLDGSFNNDLANAEAKDGALDFVGGTAGFPNGGIFGIASKVAHEIAEQVVDRAGGFKEIGDAPCNAIDITYRGWWIQKLWSEWDGKCMPSDSAVSLRQFLRAIGVQQLSGLRVSTVNVDFIAATMQFH